MPSVHDGDLAAQGDFWAAVATLDSNRCQGTQSIGGGNCGCGKLDAYRLLCQVLSQSGEDLIFQGGQPLLGGEYLVFQILQLLGDVALAVGEGLLADVMLRHLVGQGFGHLDIVAEDPVVAHPQGADAGFLFFRGFDSQNGALATIHNVPQTVSLFVGTGTDDAALPNGQGRFVHNSIFDQVGTVIQRINGLFQLLQQGRFQLLQLLLDHR